jgi:hypothetical protein
MSGLEMILCISRPGSFTVCAKRHVRFVMTKVVGARLAEGALVAAPPVAKKLKCLDNFLIGGNSAPRRHGMKIEVRNLKHSPSLSEETNAYTATIYVDGKRAIDASNHGTGGPDMYRPIAPFTYKDIERVDAWLKANNPKDTSYGIEIEHSLEIEIGDQVENILARKQLDKILRTKITVIVGDHLESYPAKHKPDARNIAAVKAKGETVVNGDPALYEKALKLLMA